VEPPDQLLHCGRARAQLVWRPRRATQGSMGAGQRARSPAARVAARRPSRPPLALSGTRLIDWRRRRWPAAGAGRSGRASGGSWRRADRRANGSACSSADWQPSGVCVFSWRLHGLVAADWPPRSRSLARSLTLRPSRRSAAIRLAAPIRSPGRKQAAELELLSGCIDQH